MGLGSGFNFKVLVFVLHNDLKMRLWRRDDVK